MAASELTVTPLVRTGVALLATDVAANVDGNFFDNTGKEMLAVRNASGGSINVTIQTSITVDSQTVADLVVACADAETTLIGPFPVGFYNDAEDEVNITYSAATNIHVAVIKLTPGV
jgi:hypothetical protein